jgi:hypothetical protein
LRLGETKNFTTLCRTCAQTKTAFELEIGCNHTDDERMIESIFTGQEIQYAVSQQNYKIITIKKIVYYPKYCYNMFHDILAIFAKKKICSKGNL